MKWNFHIKINFIILTRMINIGPPSGPTPAFCCLERLKMEGRVEGGVARPVVKQPPAPLSTPSTHQSFNVAGVGRRVGLY